MSDAHNKQTINFSLSQTFFSKTFLTTKQTQNGRRVYNPLPLNSQGHPRDLRSRHRRRNLGPSRRDDGAGKRFLRFLKQGFIVIRSYRYFVPTFALTLPTPTPTPTYLVHPRRSRLNGKEPPRPDLNPSEGVRVLGGWVVGGR